MKAKCKARVGAAIGRAPTNEEAGQIDREIKRSMRALSKSDPDWKGKSAEERLVAASEHAAGRREDYAEQADALFQSEQDSTLGLYSAALKAAEALPRRRMKTAEAIGRIEKGRGVENAGRVKEEVKALKLREAFSGQEFVEPGEIETYLVENQIALGAVTIESNPAGVKRASKQELFDLIPASERSLHIGIDAFKTITDGVLRMSLHEYAGETAVYRAKPTTIEDQYVLQVKESPTSVWSDLETFDGASSAKIKSSYNSSLRRAERRLYEHISENHPDLMFKLARKEELADSITSLNPNARIEDGGYDLDDSHANGETRITLPEVNEDSFVGSTHSGEKNEAVNILWSVRPDDSGKKSFFIRQLQSDEGQERSGQVRAEKKDAEADNREVDPDYLPEPLPLVDQTSQWVGAGLRAALIDASRRKLSSVSIPTAETSTYIQGNSDAAQHYETNVLGSLERIANQMGATVREGTVQSDDGPHSAYIFELTPKIRKSLRNDGLPLYQPDGDAGRASVSIPGGFGVGKILKNSEVIVRLTEAADRTSFLHETAHIFLEIYTALEGQSTEIDTQLSAIRDWLGIKPGEAITRDQHEKFADSFELYLMKGVAPSPELRGAFVQFRQWFVNVYRNIRHRLNKLDSEAIEIFNAMLATDEEIGLAIEDYQRYRSGYMAETMSEAQLEKYKKYGDQARSVAEDKLFKKHLAQIQKRHKAEYRRAKKDTTARVREELEAQPVYRAREAIKGQKLDRELVRELREEGFGRETTEEGGAHPEIVAADAGFTSADAMLTALEAAPALDAEVQRIVQAELDAEYGNLLTDGSAEQEAVAAVFNEPSIRMMEAERDALAEKAAGDAIPLAAIRAKADRDINELPIKDAITPGRYAIKARDLHKRSVRAAAAGKWDLALRYTHQAMLQHEKARRAYKARDEISRGERALARFRRHKKLDPKKIDPEYIAALRILADLPGQENQQEARNLLNAFAIKQEAEGGHVLLPTAVVLGEDLKDKRDMSLDEWRDYKGSMQSLAKLGRDLSAEARAAQKAEALAIADTIREGWEGRPAKDKRRDKTFRAKIAKALREGDAMILRFPFLIEALQGGGTDGTLVRKLELKLRQALTERNNRRVEIGRQLAAIFEKHGITQAELGKKLEVPELDGAPIKFERILVAAMNMGTESNRERMASDPNTADIEAIDAMLDARLDKRHWDAVQDVWNLLGSLWPESAVLERRLTGSAPKKLPHRSFTNEHGTYKGGYFPVQYRSDIAANADIKEKQSEDRFKALKSGIATRTNTPQGRLKERQATTGRPLELSLEAVLSHIDDTTTDLYLREEATRLDRIFRDPQFRAAIEDTHGIEYLKTLDIVLKRTVSGSERAQDVGERFLQGFRVNASVAILGANLPTALLAPVSYFQTIIPRYGIKAVLSGVTEFFSNPVATNRLIMEKSAFMRERQDTYNRESHELVRKTPLQSKWGKIQGAGYLLMTTAEKYSVSGPIWIAVYRQSIINGETEADAITLADRAIATTQGSGLEIDQAPLQSGNEGMRALTFMWGYLSGYYGTVRGDIASQDGIAKILPAMKHLIFMNAIAATLETIVRGELWDDDDDPYIVEFLNRFRRNIEGLIPGISLATSPFDSSAPAIQSAKGVVDVARSYGDVAEDIYEQGYVDAETAQRAARETLKGFGIAAGVPGTIQADKALKTYFEDDDPTIMEYLMTGPDSDN